MRTCDCSNCLPAEAEQLWLAQRALKNDNIDIVLSMAIAELKKLVQDMPDTPAPPTTESRPVVLRCVRDDPILGFPLLEQLVTRLERAFAKFFSGLYPHGSDLGPDDFLGRELAWDVAKNLDILRVPSDLGLIIASEAIPGQYNCLFDTFLRWKDKHGSIGAVAEAAKRRRKAHRPSGPPKIPQSLEGLQMAKVQADLDKAALIDACEAAKASVAKQKAAIREQRAQEKLSRAAVNDGRQSSKRPVEGSVLPTPTNKRALVETVHQTHPNGNELIEPRLCPR
ncbi:uncharacterized protein MELLADRAFT_118241 [Melampsora larici-populina 98AG31]|uniref:Uncharacterized protein n=1 Tax=Melampsora larici-populina (strain 98AG31 / pathotype 3-4-7) TaxID=747676 RepID=F4S6P9_MELLP|nr:uncharacterized protein MELLADRAFT_118241 [Melampsora larici-populina 98AG31]EGF99681.1 hypothetical protein MELLADRAFT_118241 [Melampsora larici-populina 98AG31]